ELNGFELRLSGNHPAVLIVHNDRYGAIASVTDIFAKHEINIGHMEVNRKDVNQEALMVIEVDQNVNDTILEQLNKAAHIIRMSKIDGEGGLSVMFRTVSELVELAEKENIPISEVMIRQEMNVKDVTREEIFEQMENNLQVMEDAIEKSLAGVESVTGMTGGDAVLVQKYIKNNQTLSGDLLLDAVSKAMGTNEVNAAMGTVCATPTAGSAGCVPGMLFAVKNRLNPTREEMIRYLLTSGAFGFVVAN